jgi:hypothetical protein
MRFFDQRVYVKYPYGEVGAAIMQTELELLHLPLAKEASKYTSLYAGAK